MVEDQKQNVDMTEPQKESRIKKEIISWIKVLIAAIMLAFICSHYVFLPIEVEGSSMYPTLEDGEFGISNVFKRRFMEVERGDIVVVHFDETDEYWVKRVIGLPNETITCRDDVVYVNGKALNEPYLDQTYVESIRKSQGVFTEDFGPVTLADDEYFLMGDNRPASFDSRRLKKMFTLEDIQSAGGVILFPFDKIKTMH